MYLSFNYIQKNSKLHSRQISPESWSLQTNVSCEASVSTLPICLLHYQTACFILTFSAFTRSSRIDSRIRFCSFSCEMKFPETVDYRTLWRHRIITKLFVFNEKVEEKFFFVPVQVHSSKESAVLSAFRFSPKTCLLKDKLICPRQNLKHIKLKQISYSVSLTCQLGIKRFTSIYRFC